MISARVGSLGLLAGSSVAGYSYYKQPTWGQPTWGQFGDTENLEALRFSLEPQVTETPSHPQTLATTEPQTLATTEEPPEPSMPTAMADCQDLTAESSPTELTLTQTVHPPSESLDTLQLVEAPATESLPNEVALSGAPSGEESTLARDQPLAYADYLNEATRLYAELDTQYVEPLLASRGETRYLTQKFWSQVPRDEPVLKFDMAGWRDLHSEFADSVRPHLILQIFQAKSWVGGYLAAHLFKWTGRHEFGASGFQGQLGHLQEIDRQMEAGDYLEALRGLQTYPGLDSFKSRMAEAVRQKLQVQLAVGRCLTS